MQSKAFLLDLKNAKKLSGSLLLQEGSLTFVLDDFEQSHLLWKLQIVDIQIITFFKLFNITNAGIHIFSKNGKQDVFILENPEQWVIQLTIKNE